MLCSEQMNTSTEKMRIRATIASAFFVAVLGTASAEATIVRFETVMGNFDVRLFDGAMPRSTANFLQYTTANKYNGTVVHRNSDTSDTSGGPLRDFVIQGGGYSFIDPTPPNTTITYATVVKFPAIADEPGGGVKGLSNLRGTIAMAKSGPNTVTSEWFINQGNNSFLDDPTRSDGGFSAFGAVLGNGMTVVDAIGDLPLPPEFGFSIGSPFSELPLRNFTGNSISQIRVANTVTVTSVHTLNFAKGDYDFNGKVDSADYMVWKNSFGSTTAAEADGNGNGKVDAADYTIWRDSFGQMSGPGSGSASGVPEPASFALLLLAAGVLLVWSRRRIWRRFSGTPVVSAA
jgi:peptidyl-prolyl cis-trans isomerase A (cyclophilin A)